MAGLTIFLSIKGLEPVFARNGEFLTAVTAACRKDATSIGSAHTLTESVLVDSLAV